MRKSLIFVLAAMAFVACQQGEQLELLSGETLVVEGRCGDDTALPFRATLPTMMWLCDLIRIR